jgi:hypothetical protein
VKKIKPMRETAPFDLFLRTPLSSYLLLNGISKIIILIIVFNKTFLFSIRPVVNFNTLKLLRTPYITTTSYYTLFFSTVVFDYNNYKNIKILYVLFINRNNSVKLKYIGKTSILRKHVCLFLFSDIFIFFIRTFKTRGIR